MTWISFATLLNSVCLLVISMNQFKFRKADMDGIDMLMKTYFVLSARIRVLEEKYEQK